jgi:hypothetical protein
MKQKVFFEIILKGGVNLSDSNKAFWGSFFKALITFASAIVGAWLGTGV